MYTPFWGYKRTEDRSGGTAILVKNELCTSMQFVQKNLLHLYGGATCVEFTINEIHYNIMNVYAPQTNRNVFFNELSKSTNNKSFLCGDMNCVVDESFDLISQSKTKYDNAGSLELNRLLTSHQLSDSFRIENGLSFDYTKKSATQNGVTLTRIDYIFNPEIENTRISTSINHTRWSNFSDHSGVDCTITFEKSTTKKSPDLHVLNENLIYDPGLHSDLTKITNEILVEIENAENPLKVYDQWIKRVRTKWLKATKIIQKKINKELKVLNITLT